MLNRRVIQKTVEIGMACAGVATIGTVAYLAAPIPTVIAATTPAHNTPAYSQEIAPLLNKNCGSCHSSTRHKGGLVMDSYDSLMRGGKHGQVILPHDAKASRMIRMIEGEDDPQMPLESDPLLPAQVAILKAWIDAGAPGPAANETTEVFKQPSIPDIHPEVKVVSPVTSVRFSPTGDLLAVGGYQQVRLIDPASENLIATLPGHADYVRSIAFSPDGSLIAAAGGAPQSQGEIKIWNVQTHHLMKTLQGHKDCIYSIAWSPDGKLLASGSYDRMVKLWDVAAGKELINLQDHIDAVFAVAFSPDGKRLASASQDRTVKIWNVATGKRLYTVSDALDGLTSIAFSASGDQVASAGYDKTIYIWRLAEDDGHLSRSLIADEDGLLALIWSPDDKTIVTASSDGSIRFRDAATLNPIGVIDKQSDWVQALAISPDGKWLAAGRYDGSLSLYDAKSYKPMKDPMTVFDPPQRTNQNQASEAGK